MELYTKTAYKLSRQLTTNYSTSFSTSSRLFARSIRPHIFAIYGLVRIADEIVDTYRGPDAGAQLDKLQNELKAGLNSGFSTNPIVHAFINTAKKYHINSDLIEPFFSSMRSDLANQAMTPAEYEKYIHGSAEVVGLMCLKVFTADTNQYDQLEPGAKSLGAAYQKINFLRDMRADFHELGRVYFPGVDYTAFDEAAKSKIVADIKSDLRRAQPAVMQLPSSSRRAVLTSLRYYSALLKRLEKSSASTIKSRRIRVSALTKLIIYVGTRLGL